MKQIISLKSSRFGVDMEKENVPDSLLNLQIVCRIEKLIGSKMPGNQFEAAALSCRFFQRRAIKKRAKDLNSWAIFLKMVRVGDINCLLLTPSVKIVDEKTQPLTQQEILSCLKEAEAYAEEKRHSSYWIRI